MLSEVLAWLTTVFLPLQALEDRMVAHQTDPPTSQCGECFLSVDPEPLWIEWNQGSRGWPPPPNLWFPKVFTLFDFTQGEFQQWDCENASRVKTMLTARLLLFLEHRRRCWCLLASRRWLLLYWGMCSHLVPFLPSYSWLTLVLLRTACLQLRLAIPLPSTASGLIYSGWGNGSFPP